MLDGGGPAELAGRLASSHGAALDEVFASISTLYFRGKRAYAQRFGLPPGGVPGGWMITSSRGLLPLGAPVRLDDLREMAERDIAPDDARYLAALRSAARTLRSRIEGGRVVLLGSLASDRYVPPLLEVFGDALEVPLAFVGRGDMSRGGLMLRCVEAGRELDYAPVRGLERRGPRPPRLGEP